MKLVIGNNQKTMSSREIGLLCNVPHESVLKTVRSLVDRGVVLGNETPYKHEQNGQQYPEFLLSFRDTMIVASGYSPELRAKVVDLSCALLKYPRCRVQRLLIWKRR